ncbi:MAG TPA: hypothetical protein VJ650_09770 [Gemmatimonadaceae bacterium]|nr:hypothetical protein [Gemmatimonadaceae bacterium]
MRLMYVVHIVAGGIGLLAGYFALYSAKGAARHRRAGMVFVYAMLTVCVAGTAIAALRNVAPALNIPAAVLTSYLVITSLITVRAGPPHSRWLDVGLLMAALAVGLTCLTFGFEAAASPDGKGRNGMPAFPFFMFGVVGTLAAGLDLKMMRSRRLTGPARLARHLWRMSFALFIAALSFFIGQAQVFPKPIRIMPMLALPVVAVLLTMFYWLWRIRIKRSIRGIVTAPASEAI